MSPFLPSPTYLDLLIQSDVNIDWSSLYSMQKQSETVKGSFDCIGAEAQTSAGVASTSSAAPHDSGLSEGAKAGIGTGVGLGVLLVLGGALVFFTRQRRRRVLNEDHVTVTYGPLPSADKKKEEVDDAALYELAPASKVGLPKSAQRHQLPTHSERHQLPSGDERRGCLLSMAGVSSTLVAFET